MEAPQDAPFGSRETQTFFAGLTPDAMIAPWAIKGPMNGSPFAAYVEKVRVSYPPETGH